MDTEVVINYDDVEAAKTLNVNKPILVYIIISNTYKHPIKFILSFYNKDKA